MITNTKSILNKTNKNDLKLCTVANVKICMSYKPNSIPVHEIEQYLTVYVQTVDTGVTSNGIKQLLYRYKGKEVIRTNYVKNAISNLIRRNVIKERYNCYYPVKIEK